MSNPYTPYFDRLDELVPVLESNNLDDDQALELAGLARRAAFFIANTLNTAAQASPHLILPVEGTVKEAEDTDSGEHGTT